MNPQSKTTPLHEWHVTHGANMAEFGGYDMPLWYSSAKNEHLAVLTHAGIFDTSHMAALTVEGEDAFDLLQHCFTQDLAACVGAGRKPLSPGRCVYGACLDSAGEVIDDSIINQVAEGSYMLVVNAGMGAPVAEHLNACSGTRRVRITDLTDRLGKMDVQGPAAAKIVRRIIAEPERVLDGLPYFSFKGHFDPARSESETVRLLDGTPVLLSRTGYTGEFGFELFVAADKIVSLWQRVLAAGEPFGVTPCGLAARDSLRAGAVLPLSHQDIGPWPFHNNPWPFALPLRPEGGFSKEFLGADALRKITRPQYTYPFVGRDLRKVSTPAAVHDSAGDEIGTVLTCATDMGIGWAGDRLYSLASPDRPDGFRPKGVCCGFVKVSRPLSAGTPIELRDARRKIQVTITADIRPDRTARRPLKEML